MWIDCSRVNSQNTVGCRSVGAFLHSSVHTSSCVCVCVCVCRGSLQACCVRGGFKAVNRFNNTCSRAASSWPPDPTDPPPLSLVFCGSSHFIGISLVSPSHYLGLFIFPYFSLFNPSLFRHRPIPPLFPSAPPHPHPLRMRRPDTNTPSSCHFRSLPFLSV